LTFNLKLRPIKITRPATSISKTLNTIAAPTTISNKDITPAILSAQDTQTNQYEELCSSITTMTSDVAILEAENVAIRIEICVLKANVEVIKSKAGEYKPGGILATQILHESIKRLLCDQNAIIFELPKSSALIGSLRATDNKTELLNILTSISVKIAIELFLVGSIFVKKPRILKPIFCSSIN